MAAIPTSDMLGHVALADKARTALETCQETQAVEFMASQPWKTLQHGITKTALAMGNLRDGGMIIVGVGQGDDGWKLTGISQDDLATYSVDKVIDQVNAFVSPHVDLTVVIHQWQGSPYLVIQVKEFLDKPLVCKKNYKSELVEGAVYLRAPGQPRNKLVTNANEMHELLELAAEKKLRQFVELARRVGLIATPLAEQRLKEELGGL